MKKKEEAPKFKITMEYVEKCVDPAKDLLAHRRFLEVSGLVFNGETERSSFPPGPEGWDMWRRQFTLAQEQGRNMVENGLNLLYRRGKIKPEEYSRLRRLYGLELEIKGKTGEGGIVPGKTPEQTILTNCPACHAKIDPGSNFCSYCGFRIRSP